MKKRLTVTDTSAPDKAKSTKQASVLRVLAEGGSLNRFQAERIGDHALNSTISTLRNAYGLPIEGTPETVPTRFGKPARCHRYRLPESERAHAFRLLSLWGSVGGE